MNKWMTPVLEELDVTLTENGFAPARFPPSAADPFRNRRWIYAPPRDT